MEYNVPPEYRDAIIGEIPAGGYGGYADLPFMDPLYDWKVTGSGALAKQITDASFLDDVLGIADVSMAKVAPVPVLQAEPTISPAERRLTEIFGERPFVSRDPVESDEQMDLLKRRKAALKPAKCDCACDSCKEGDCKGCESDEKCGFSGGKSDKVTKMLSALERKLVKLYGAEVVTTSRVEDAMAQLRASIDNYCDQACAEFAR